MAMVLSDNTKRLLRVEAKLDALLEHLNVNFDPRAAVRKAARNRGKLAGIRLHRSLLGSTLSQAKREVEALIGAKAGQ